VNPTPLAERLRLDGRVALVTGATGQLGSAFCHTLSEAGAHVVAADLRESADVRSVDITDPDSVERLLAAVAKDHGQLDILVNNAGIGVYTPLAERELDDLARVSAVNLSGTVLCTRAASRLMQDSGGSVVNIGSIYGIVSPDPRIYGSSGRNSSEIYGATKAGVIQLTKWLAVHLAGARIRVNAISPGGVFADQEPQFVREYESRTPLGRMATVDDVQGALLFLASDASSYVTGHNLVVDGGWSVW
jgi:NAD(P)-dependent dehydrogenase (short-subunit alcohol dehydrogenase family)